MAQKSLNVQEFLHLRDVEKRSFQFIADWLGFSRRGLELRLKRDGIQGQLKRAPFTRPNLVPKADRIAKRFGFENMAQLIAHHRPTMMQKEIAEMVGVSVPTVQYHTPEDCKFLYFHHTEETKQKWLKALDKANKSARKTKRDHYWSKSW